MCALMKASMQRKLLVKLDLNRKTDFIIHFQYIFDLSSILIIRYWEYLDEDFIADSQQQRKREEVV